MWKDTSRMEGGYYCTYTTYLHEGLWSRVWHLQGISLLTMVRQIYVRWFVAD